MRNKKYMVLLVLSFLFLIVVGSMYSYSLYESKSDQAIAMKVANWDIKVNDSLVTSGEELVKEFTINDMTLTGENEYVTKGLFAPGISGTFTLKIDPTDTEVSFKYYLTVDGSKITNNMIKITEVAMVDSAGNKIPGGDLTLVDADKGIYEGYVYYDDDTKTKVETERCTYIKITITWLNDDNNNEADTSVGTSSDNPKLDIPVKMNFEQYVG